MVLLRPCCQELHTYPEERNGFLIEERARPTAPPAIGPRYAFDTLRQTDDSATGLGRKGW